LADSSFPARSAARGGAELFDWLSDWKRLTKAAARKKRS
jgi:hypothetical protein